MLNELLKPPTISARPAVEEIGEENMEDDAEIDDSEVYADQKLPEEEKAPELVEITTYGYGFGWQRHNVFSQFDDDIVKKLVSIPSPDTFATSERVSCYVMITAEEFRSEHHLMGASTSKSAVIANLSSPMYCLNMVGSRHILMAGGGGGSKTGVKNELQTWLFGYDTDISSAPSIQRDDAGARIREAVTVDTSPYATMDLDVTPLGVPGDGRYLIATSHDHFCDVYETDGFEVVERDDAPPTVGFTPRLVAHFESVTVANKKNDKYQKGVKFANIEGSLLIVTAGSDGRIKTWSVDDILRNAANVIPLREWTVCDSEIDQIEVTADGTTLFTIGQRSLLVWDVATGRQLKEINSPEGYAPRCVRFTKKDKRNNIFFVVGYNPNVPRGKKSMIVHFVLSLTQSDQFAVVGKADVFSEKISKMGVQRGGKWMAVGTMEGSVAIYKLDDLVAAKKIIGTHRDSFITGIEVLPERTDDFPDLKDENGKSLEFYGPHAEAAVSVVTTSNDLTVQLHSVPYYDSKPSIVFALILSILLMIIFPALVALIANL